MSEIPPELLAQMQAQQGGPPQDPQQQDPQQQGPPDQGPPQPQGPPLGPAPPPPDPVDEAAHAILTAIPELAQNAASVADPNQAREFAAAVLALSQGYQAIHGTTVEPPAPGPAPAAGSTPRPQPGSPSPANG